jgi:hypothetical protein
MDSVYEARLNDPKDSERAIRKLGRLTRNIAAYMHVLMHRTEYGLARKDGSRALRNSFWRLNPQLGKNFPRQ